MRNVLWPVVALLLIAAACTSEPTAQRSPGGDGSSVDNTGDGAEQTTTTEPLPRLVLDVQPGPYQLTIDQVPTSLAAGTRLDVADEAGVSVGQVEVADNGSVLIRDLPPGTIRIHPLDDRGERLAETELFEVPEGGEVDEAIYGPWSYDQLQLEPGFNYLRTRDGTELSTFVTLPGPIEDGPFPTLVEYSGYAPSRPDGDDPARLVTSALGYALVQVNVRGTGCSGGSFDAFEPVQAVDGYDVIETVAAQGWSAKVGMYGVSYAGIMQLHVAAAKPPSLAAIAPMSVLDDVGSVLYPGGVYNNGFAETWTRQVNDGAEAYGQGWERSRVDGGDQTCEANQELRVHNPDLVALIREVPFANELTASRSPITRAGDIEVPVFLAGAWQDEQTGPYWPTLINELTGAPTLRVLMYNGLHVDPISPEVLASVTEFYDLYLDDPNPGAGLIASFGLSAGLGTFFGEILPIPFRRVDSSLMDEARQTYAAAPPIRVLFDMGASKPNLPVPSFSASFEQWPPAEVEPTEFLLQPLGDGFRLGTSGLSTSSSAAFVTDPDDGEVTTTDDAEQIWTNDPRWDWPAAAEPNRLTATGDVLRDDLVMVGPASADLWVTADQAEADIEVTLSEIGPDSSETYVQSGLLRLSRRTLDDEASSALRPVTTDSAADVAPLVPDGEPVLARVEIPPFAHVFRTGSRIRITIDTPGASRAQWRFDVVDQPVEVTVHTGPSTSSKLVLPVLPGLEAPTTLPRCGTLRGQPCRPG